ncbi:MAG: hypothetical protein LUH09_07335 [Clostridiales bacterium]|nr:hypothetical protein [Clostridiales bacterium]
MSEVRRKQGLGFWLLLMAFVVTVAGTVLYCVNANYGYYNDFAFEIPLLSALIMVLEVLLLSLPQRMGERQWMDIFYPIIGVLLAIAMVMFLSVRAESAGTILGSSLEADNEAAHYGLAQSFVGMGCYLVASFLAGAAGFSRQVGD